MDIFRAEGITVSTSGYGNVFSLWPSPQPPANYAQALAFANAEFSTALHLALRQAGLLVMPSVFGRLYLSFEHSDGVVLEMTAAFKVAAAKLAARFAAGRPAPAA